MWLSNFTLVLPNEVVSEGSVRVEGGVIAEIRPEPVAGAAIDGGRRLLMPGFVDLHGDMIEREIAPRPNATMPIDFGIHELDKKLAAAGVTTAFAAVSFATESVYGHVRSLETTSAVIEGINRLRDDLLIDHRVHARYEITNVGAAPALERLLNADQIDMVSLTDHTPGQGQYNNLQSYIRSISERRAISEEMAAEIVAKRIAMRNNADIEAKLKEIVALSLKHKLSLASHDDDSVEKVAEMHDLGVTISEFPVTAPAAEEARRRGLWTLMGAPNALRGQSMSGNLSALDAARAGLLSVIAADYHPAAFVPGIFKLADMVEGGLPAAVAMATGNAARSAGLSDRGEIAVGQRADLVVVEPGDVHRIRATFRAGRFVYSDGTLHPLRALAA
ncbi:MULTISPECIES: alpha-D-ribose 1-methylphosphonate 5-triphosphate diphosphatase [Rhizobium]|jgi:alpha-D-ribose 1-methylphosphonate 5-triphosphate diphosphatase|uniref:alpha-D-ribose 1-methylphosphonate 5-triphosphate diphosphatase n=1 Tax=Rhizobium TaxID=379 RepID=UPI000522EBAA|nr:MULTISPECIES: alpha-D-ribose 1-methylphosphonate 5-triphosphate diphosphatase [Rhizobium]KPN28202.1 phosphonate metabolism protein PhnM [Rhizobium brockwellii]MDV4158709.1 alpha-D-ribose 1-methylphosphonate 5-triphosphate diphosphatase [Rhizobium brockwellii]QJX04569.1 alpha-D-ribose 1-methylphosphonate 5-triphosphate diphosphatase [Rhizobium brockwellii]TAX38639.1 alpha-D-ribose 1-methylphosphonate 5-triphosphate diphosphatase [Rhizobium leguminosarum]TAX96154.1 alpha-D-ribose 1-methylphos